MSVARKHIRFLIAVLLVLTMCATAVVALAACNKNNTKPNTVTFVYWQFEDGTRTTVTQDIENNKISEPSTPEGMEGYTFEYWTVEGQDTPFNFDTEVTASITLVAKFKKNTAADTITVTYVYGNGDDDLVRNIVNGKVVQIKNPVRPYYEFECWTIEGSDTPFDFNTTVTESIVLVAKWKQATSATAKLFWSDENSGASFVFDGATPTEANIGDTVTFKIKISPYFTGTPSVTAGTSKVECDKNGVYSFVVAEEVTVSISGLVRDNTPISGRGTAYDPYIITTPAQFKDVIDAINNINNKTYNAAYIKLGADIDFEGETIDPMGVDLYYDMMFCGDFNGDGHTVKNFEISDKYFVVGLFGLINGAYISNLNVETDIYASVPASGLFVGGVAAYNFASDIVGCTYNGSITLANSVDSSTVNIVAGGIVGFVQGTDGVAASVAYCSAQAELSVTGTKDITALGGIAGVITGNSAQSTAHVFNCVADVTMDGYSQAAGGIVGWMRQLSSVDNCYAAGTIETRGISEEPIKGGIVGDAYNENSVTYCLSIVKIGGASNVSENNGGIVGMIRPAKLINVDDRETVTVGNVYAANEEISLGGISYNVLNIMSLNEVLQAMGWNAAEWKKTDGKILPNADGANKVAINVTFKFSSPYNEHTEVTLAEMVDNESMLYGYIPISYVFDGDGLNTLTADNGRISYGFFLDEELTKRVSASYLLTGHATTIYVGFADYSAMAGEYYAVVGNADVKLTFDDNGKMTMYTDGKRAYYMYVFDGEKAVIHDSYFLRLYYDYLGVSASGNVAIDVYAELTDTGLKIYDDVIFTGEDRRAPIIIANGNNGLLGTWYTRGQTQTYTFNADGTGVVSTGDQFTYTLSVRNVRINLGNRTINARLSDDGFSMQTSDGTTLSITKYDDFNGTWESAFNDCTKVSFDGVNTAKIGSKTYTYYIEDGILISEGLRAYFNEDNLLVMDLGDDTLLLGREGSYIGTWKDTGIGYEFILLGINKDGFGEGYDSYGYNFTYTFENDTISMYYRTTLYGFGTMSKGNDKGAELLYLAVYTPSSGMLVDDYNMSYVDAFEGVWNSDNGMTLSFNGNGAYDIYLDTISTTWEVRGFVTITDNGKTSVVRYYYDRATATATFEYNDKECVASLIENGISVKIGDDTVEFAEPDELSLYDWYTDGVERIHFDGRGNVGGGNVTFSVGGTDKTYGYELVQDGYVVNILDGEDIVYTLDVATMTLKKDGQTVGVLGVYHDILGRVYSVNGTEGNVFELDCSNLFDADGIATGKWNTTSVVYSYVSQNTIAVYDSNMSSAVFYLVYVDENTVIIANVSSSGTLEAYSIAFIPDELIGTYYNADNSEKLIIDGSSKNSYMLSSAVFFEIDEDGEQTSDEVRYTYFKENGVWGIYSYNKVDYEFEYTLVYTVSLQEVDGAVAYTTADKSKTVWIKQA